MIPALTFIGIASFLCEGDGDHCNDNKDINGANCDYGNGGI